MLRNARTWIALAVIAGGIIAAVVLPKDDSETPDADRQQEDGLVRRDFDFDSAISQAQSHSPATVDTPVAEVPAVVGPSPLDIQHAPPQLDDVYPDHGPVGEHRLSPEVFRNLARPSAETTLAGVRPGQPPSAKPVTHKIVDGDTLHMIAQRYLGDADRYLDIFHANRDRLRSPGVLPIGIELRIPIGESPATAAPRVNASPVSVGLGALQVKTASSEPERGAAPMVEIRPGTLRSIPVESDQEVRTYRVREGDTLVSIARRLYGDGRRYRDIFEANRDQLKGPNALPVGVLLVLP